MSKNPRQIPDLPEDELIRKEQEAEWDQEWSALEQDQWDEWERDHWNEREDYELVGFVGHGPTRKGHGRSCRSLERRRRIKNFQGN